MSLIDVTVNCEATGSIVELWLTLDEYERAKNDTEFVRDLVARHVANEMQEEEHIPRSQNNDYVDESTSLFIWNNQAVQLLLTLYEEHSKAFNDGIKRHKKIWEEISQKVIEMNKNYILTGGQCQTKLNGLKRTYKKNLDHNSKSGNDRASWPFFDRMHEIFGTIGWAQPKALASEAGPFTQESQTSQSETATRKKSMAAREKNRKEKEEKKETRFKQLLEQKERHHKEKIELIRFILSKDK